MAGITSGNNLSTRRHRTYPRVVKRARHNSYRVKKSGDHGIRHDGPPTIQLANPVLGKCPVSSDLAGSQRSLPVQRYRHEWPGNASQESVPYLTGRAAPGGIIAVLAPPE
jgi:hypothetical protein